MSQNKIVNSETEKSKKRKKASQRMWPFQKGEVLNEEATRTDWRKSMEIRIKVLC